MNASDRSPPDPATRLPDAMAGPVAPSADARKVAWGVTLVGYLGVAALAGWGAWGPMDDNHPELDLGGGAFLVGSALVVASPFIVGAAVLTVVSDRHRYLRAVASAVMLCAAAVVGFIAYGLGDVSRCDSCEEW